MDDPDELELGDPGSPGSPIVAEAIMGATDVIEDDVTRHIVYDLNITDTTELDLHSTAEVIANEVSSDDQADVQWTWPYDCLPSEAPTKSEKEGPEVVAVETVVTTTMPKGLLHRKLRMANMDVKLTSEDMEKVELSDDPDLNVDGFSFAEINWNDPQVMDKVLANTSVATENVALDLSSTSVMSTGTGGAGHPQWFIAVVPDPNGDVVTIPQQVLPSTPALPQQSLQDLRKREKDRAKKRELRQNPLFRSKEKEQAKIRMRLKRTDPEYRQKEREKDRVRRRQARLRNSLNREKERERDKQYKRLHRVVSHSTFTKTDSHLPYQEVEDLVQEVGIDVIDSDKALDVC